MEPNPLKSPPEHIAYISADSAVNRQRHQQTDVRQRRFHVQRAARDRDAFAQRRRVVVVTTGVGIVIVAAAVSLRVDLFQLLQQLLVAGLGGR